MSCQSNLFLYSVHYLHWAVVLLVFWPRFACFVVYFSTFDFVSVFVFFILFISNQGMASSTTTTNDTNRPATCTLVIDNFSTCTTKESSVFFIPSDSATSFLLCVNANNDMSGMTYWNAKCTSFSLFLNSSSNNAKITVRYRMSIVNAKGQKCLTQGMLDLMCHCQYEFCYSRWKG